MIWQIRKLLMALQNHFPVSEKISTETVSSSWCGWKGVYLLNEAVGSGDMVNALHWIESGPIK